jgi:hypothetical protein
LVAAAAVALFPSQAAAQPVETAPSYHAEADAGGGGARPGLLIAGLSTLGSCYLATTALATANRDDYQGTYYALIPVAGPFITAAALEPRDSAWLTFPDEMRVFYMTLGVGQVAGAALTVAGVALPTSVRVGTGHVTVTPTVSGSAAGAVALGSF